MTVYDLPAEIAARVAGLPREPAFLAGIADGRWHALHEVYVVGAITAGHSAAGTLCRRQALLPQRVPGFARDALPAGAQMCAYCRWAAAAEQGMAHLRQELGALTPAGPDLAALSRLVPDPLLAARACEAILVRIAPGSGADGSTVKHLAHVTEHAPALLRAAGCAAGECGHTCGECPASAVCLACSLHTGPWTGEGGQVHRIDYLGSAPCPVLTTFAVGLGVA